MAGVKHFFPSLISVNEKTTSFNKQDTRGTRSDLKDMGLSRKHGSKLTSGYFKLFTIITLTNLLFPQLDCVYHFLNCFFHERSLPSVHCWLSTCFSNISLNVLLLM